MILIFKKFLWNSKIFLQSAIILVYVMYYYEEATSKTKRVSRSRKSGYSTSYLNA